VVDQNEDVGWAAKTALREFRTPGAVEPLIKGAGHPAPKARAAAIWALRDLRAPSAQSALIKATLDPDAIVRKEALLALAYLRSPETLVVFKEAVGDPDAEIRRMVAAALSSFGEVALPNLMGLALDTDWQVRSEAVTGLGRFSNERVLPPLLRALEDEVWQVVKVAIAGLGKPIFPVAQRLIPFLFDPSSDIRISTATSLGEIGDNSVLPQIRQLLTDPDTGVQKAADRAIKRLSTQA